MGTPELEQRAIAVIRGLAMDAPHQARSGHQGTAMALAPLAHVLWTRILRYDATDPEWPDRDRFVLSAGHASILLYSMLHLTGTRPARPRAFRQWGSHAGHPDRGPPPRRTTGPARASQRRGLAIDERSLRVVRSDVVATALLHRRLRRPVRGCPRSLVAGGPRSAPDLRLDDKHISIDGPTERELGDEAQIGRGYGGT